ncbi:MAG: GTP pyrophosphokinase family protein [Clostridia bacterium]|nr:GTP pyrophosphokinase family protein [Clostridia bacterium]
MYSKEHVAPLVGGAAQQSDSSLSLAQKISGIFDEDSVLRVKENFEELKSLLSCYKCAILEVETKFNVLNERFSLDHERNPIETIKTRMKSPESIAEKLRRRNLPFNVNSLEQIHDIAGVRVICSFVDDIYMLADCLLKQDDIRLIEQKDYIAHPKENGYRSLHLIIEIPIFLENEKRLMKVEVQLRTIAMEFWANLEHKLRYKKNLPENIAEMTASELFECAEMSAQLDLKMQNVKNCIENS